MNKIDNLHLQGLHQIPRIQLKTLVKQKLSIYIVLVEIWYIWYTYHTGWKKSNHKWQIHFSIHSILNKYWSTESKKNKLKWDEGQFSFIHVQSYHNCYQALMIFFIVSFSNLRGLECTQTFSHWHIIKYAFEYDLQVVSYKPTKRKSFLKSIKGTTYQLLLQFVMWKVMLRRSL